MKKATLFFALMLLFGCQTTQQTAPKVKVGSKLTAKANAPTPSAAVTSSTQKTAIGKGATTVTASQPSSSWTEALDVDDDGSVETSDYLYDSQKGILYTYREAGFSCPNGNPQSGSILEALYTKDNKEQKPVGSGWYLVNLNAGQCAAQKAGTFGCKFDANGNPTECGAGTVNYATGEINLVVAK